MFGICALAVSCTLSLSTPLALPAAPGFSLRSGQYPVEWVVESSQGTMDEGRLRPKPLEFRPYLIEEPDLGDRVWGIPVLTGIGVGLTAAYFAHCGDPDFCGMSKGIYGVLAFFPGMLLGHVIEEATR